jgi:transcription initiation factor TFIID subunit 6
MSVSGSLWNPDNIRDVGESVGLGNLSKDVIDLLARDVDFRIAQVLEQAIKFMRHSKRTTLHTADISEALKVLDFEPLFGYESTRPLRFGEASLGPGQPIYYIDDDEIDFEKLINAPLPKVPREISFTAHWLAIEGVQPSIPQNPTPSDSRHQDLAPKGPNANTNLAALSGADNVAVKPLIKHILSSEIQLYFERITTAILSPDQNDEVRNAAFNSVRTDPGLHQLVPYFIQFVAEKVTHQSRSLFTLKQMLQLSEALLSNKSLYIEPYVGSLIPSIVTCLLSKTLGSPTDSLAAIFEIRDLAVSLIIQVAKQYAASSSTLKSRLARTLLKSFLDPNRSLGAHYGAILGLFGVLGSDGLAVVILPHLKLYDVLLEEGVASEDATKRGEAEMVLLALLRILGLVARDIVIGQKELTNGSSPTTVSDEQRTQLVEKVGPVLGNKVADSGDALMVKLVSKIEPAPAE